MVNQSSSRPCGLLRHLGCIVYDIMILLAVFFAITGIAVGLRGGEAVPAGNLWFQSLLLITALLYFSLCWRHSRQTVGMRAWRVYLTSTQPINQSLCTIRFFGALLSWVCLGLGFITAIVNGNGLTWHDQLSNSWLEHRR